MDEKRVVACNTRMFAGDDPKQTTLTIDFSDVELSDIIEYATDSLVIKWQNALRRKKGTVVPATATYKVPKAGVRSVSTLSQEDMLRKVLGNEKVDELIELCGSIEEVIESLKKN
jgi:hypothetical protein